MIYKNTHVCRSNIPHSAHTVLGPWGIPLNSEIKLLHCTRGFSHGIEYALDSKR
jgi:hypothetical protein